MKKRLAALGVLSALLLAGCTVDAAHSDGPPPDFFQEKFQKLSDGRTVMCLYKEHATGYATGMVIDCDWDHAIVHP